jgi:hypothetical protein
VRSVSIDVLHGVEGAAEEFDAPAFAEAKRDAWQMDRARELEARLEERGVSIWRGELPPDLRGSPGD